MALRFSGSSDGAYLGTPAVFSVGTTATLLAGIDASRVEVKILNNDAANTLYLGSNPTVTTTTGFPVPKGLTFSDECGNQQIWGISTAACAIATWTTRRVC